MGYAFSKEPQPVPQGVLPAGDDYALIKLCMDRCMNSMGDGIKKFVMDNKNTPEFAQSKYMIQLFDFISEDANAVGSLLKYIVYNMSGLKLYDKNNKGGQWYVSKNIKSGDALDINKKYRTKFTIPELLVSIACSDVALASKFNNTPHDVKFWGMLCIREKKAVVQIAKLLTALLDKNIIRLDVREGFSSATPEKMVKILRTDPQIMSVVEFGACIDHIKKSINNYLTESIAAYQPAMFHLAKHAGHIQDAIRLRMRAEYGIVLKGGNIYKLIKSQFFNYLNTEGWAKRVPENILALFMESKLYRSRNESEGLSDWDFTYDTDPYEPIINGKAYNIHEICSAIFENKAPYSAQSLSSPFIESLIHHYYTDMYNTLISYTKHELDKYRRLPQILSFWTNSANQLAEHAERAFNSLGIEIQVPDKVRDVQIMFSKKEAGPNVKHGIQFANPDQLTRSVQLNKIRSVGKWANVIHDYHENIRASEEIAGPLKYYDMEIFYLSPYKGGQYIGGFDLQRLTLSLSTHITIAGISLVIPSIGELYDFSTPKPFTLGHWLHGEDESDYDVATITSGESNMGVKIRDHEMVYAAGPDAVRLKSYSLKWFVFDILAISVRDHGSKFDKRAVRLYNSIMMILVKERDPDGKLSAKYAKFFGYTHAFFKNVSLGRLLKEYILDDNAVSNATKNLFGGLVAILLDSY